MPVNPIAEFLSKLILPREIAKATGLSNATCNSVVYHADHRFNFKTAEVIHDWFVDNFGPCELHELFHLENVQPRGRHPYTGGSYTSSVPQLSLREMVCKSCNLVTPRALRNCINCNKAH